jgi:hypothetical protein
VPLAEYLRPKACRWRLQYCDELDGLFVQLMKRLDGSCGDRRFHPWQIRTLCGVYNLRCGGDHIAGRFSNPTAAVKFVNCNPYSGTWNFHTFWITCANQSGCVTPSEFIQRFHDNLKPVLERG